MKKKILFILLVGVFLLSGCGKNSESSIIKDLEKKINNSKSYYIEGTLEIVNNEDLYTYDVKVSYAKGDNYKVNLTNKVNNHEQVILRNSDGVYVVTPRINKSFKFQSDWPYNNSQVYLLKPLLDDILSDENRTFTKDGDNYKLVVAANYPNNSKLVKQEILLDKNADIKKVTVMDTNGNAQITMNFSKIDLSSKFNDNYFDLKEIIDVREENNTTENNKYNEFIIIEYLVDDTPTRVLEKVGSWEVNLDNYYTKEEINNLLFIKPVDSNFIVNELGQLSLNPVAGRLIT